MPLALLSIGPFELVLLAAVAILLFGGDLPDVARKAAGWVARIRQVSADLTRELNQHVPAPPDLRPPQSWRPPAELQLAPEERSLSRTDVGAIDAPPPAQDPSEAAEDGAGDEGDTPPVPSDAPELGRREDVPPDGWVRPPPPQAPPQDAQGGSAPRPDAG